MGATTAAAARPGLDRNCVKALESDAATAAAAGSATSAILAAAPGATPAMSGGRTTSGIGSSLRPPRPNTTALASAMPAPTKTLFSSLAFSLSFLRRASDSSSCSLSLRSASEGVASRTTG